MEQIQKEHHMSWIEVQCLEKAVDVLNACRRTLMHSYAFAFFLERNNHAELFENNQNVGDFIAKKFSSSRIWRKRPSN